MRAPAPAAAALAATLAVAASGVTGSAASAERVVYLMGTRTLLQGFAETRAGAIAMLERAVSTLEATEDQLSTWRERSAISAFNRQPLHVPWQTGAELCGVFKRVFQLRAETGGTFDPAIGRLTDVWDIHGAGRVPAPEALDVARRQSGLQLIDFDQDACTLTRTADVTLDVGAWGKGEGLDRVLQTVTGGPWMIDFGGQVAVHGLPPGQTAWTVSLADPASRHRAVLTVSLREGSLSTSAGSERDLVVNGRRIAHHLDPRTGEPASFRGSVTVWHSSALAADALSTALFVMGPEAGARWAEANRVAACYLIARGHERVEVRMTTAFRIGLVDQSHGRTTG